MCPQKTFIRQSLFPFFHLPSTDFLLHNFSILSFAAAMDGYLCLYSYGIA